ncbi:hypothetical protein A2Z22_00900 [Candidatus Woesebacteria bacterium RBG_16_34_12]|uniref:Uncharacterized protein n=1 Tax=Candidatus Woesebacteria bacterium RBG_16_34_12 TaxID=1802480 RepID=A0A1F7X8X3_9BACT|nr:MAG: hypothetical protein A2Z22_00900 [Candidatus Woesebacteria bacterium RBG_16_34_12]
MKPISSATQFIFYFPQTHPSQIFFLHPLVLFRRLKNRVYGKNIAVNHKGKVIIIKTPRTPAFFRLSTMVLPIIPKKSRGKVT